MTTRTEIEIKEKLGSVSLPDMDRAWEDMDSLLDSRESEVASPVSGNALMRLLQHPIIWLNSVLFALLLLVTSADYTVSSTRAPLAEGVEAPSMGSSAPRLPMIPNTSLSESVIDSFNSNSDLEGSVLSEDTDERINDDLLKTEATRKEDIPTICFKDPVFNFFDYAEGVPRVVKSYSELVMRDEPVSYNWFLGADLGAFPDVEMKDVYRQAGIELGVLANEGGAFSVQTSIAYNPVQIQGIIRSSSFTNSSGQPVKREEEIQRFNFLTFRTGAHFQANPAVAFSAGVQVSQLINMFGSNETVSLINTVPVTENSSGIIKNREGMTKLGGGFYFSAELQKRSWSGYITVQQGLTDRSYDAYFGNSANHTFSNVRLGIRKKLGKLTLP